MHELRLELQQRLPCITFAQWRYFSNRTINEPNSAQLPNLRPCHFSCHLVYRCQAHSWKCFQIRALPCSLFDSLMSTLSVPGIALGKFLLPLQNILPLLPRLAWFQLVGYVLGSLNSGAWVLRHHHLEVQYGTFLQHLESEGHSHDTCVSLEFLSMSRMLINVSQKGFKKKKKKKR